MIIPTFVTDWLKANGWEKFHDQPVSVMYQKESMALLISDSVINQIYIGDVIKPRFRISIPSSEQDFLTLMNILVKHA